MTDAEFDAWFERRKAVLAARRALMAPPLTHGISGYNNRKCRCEVCKAANRARKAAQRARNRERVAS